MWINIVLLISGGKKRLGIGRMAEWPINPALGRNLKPPALTGGVFTRHPGRETGEVVQGRTVYGPKEWNPDAKGYQHTSSAMDSGLRDNQVTFSIHGTGFGLIPGQNDRKLNNCEIICDSLRNSFKRHFGTLSPWT